MIKEVNHGLRSGEMAYKIIYAFYVNRINEKNAASTIGNR